MFLCKIIRNIVNVYICSINLMILTLFVDVKTIYLFERCPQILGEVGVTRISGGKKMGPMLKKFEYLCFKVTPVSTLLVQLSCLLCFSQSQNDNVICQHNTCCKLTITDQYWRISSLDLIPKSVFPDIEFMTSDVYFMTSSVSFFTRQFTRLIPWGNLLNVLLKWASGQK